MSPNDVTEAENFTNYDDNNYMNSTAEYSKGHTGIL